MWTELKPLFSIFLLSFVINADINFFLFSIGLKHEQSRPDRDEHIEILYENIRPNLKEQFDKYNTRRFHHFDAPYDTCSIMHYENGIFSIPGVTICIQQDLNTLKSYFVSKVNFNKSFKRSLEKRKIQEKSGKIWKIHHFILE